MNRRTFLASLGTGAAATAVPGLAHAAPPTSTVGNTAIPRWRGFNLLDMFQALNRPPAPVSEDELRWIRDWGFNFIRTPLDYWFWVKSDWRKARKMEPEDVLNIDESALDPIDRIVDLGRKYGL